MKGQWLARLKTEQAPEACAPKAPDDADEGVFVAFVACPPGAIQKNEGTETHFRSVRSVPPGGFSENRGSTEQRQDQAANDAQAPDWRQADAEYLRHHFACKTCCAAGHGRGTRCTAGADLWASYEAASDAAHDTNTNARRIRT